MRSSANKTGAASVPGYKPQSLEVDQAWFEERLLEKFSRYAAVHTTSDHHGEGSPSTPGQWNLAKMLAAELEVLGLAEVELTEFCYVRALLPSNAADSSAEPVGFLAHLDTSPDSPGKGVRTLVHKNYQGGIIKLPAGNAIDPAAFPALLNHLGKDILTSDGSTLLGADDKAGVAEIMVALEYLTQHPEIKHGDVEVVFTPDEEIGRGVDKIPRDKMVSRLCFTLDGDEEGTYNAECFTGWTVDVSFTGKMIHPGDARGRLVNPVAMAGMYIADIPRNESPEATDGRYGYYCPQEIRGNMEEVKFTVFIRDFDRAQIERRLNYLRRLAALVEEAFPGGSVTLKERKQYLNMYEGISKEPTTLELLARAIRDTGIEPVAREIRGGTDGARLTELGIPTPNIFAGGHNFHSVLEWVPLQSMARASKVVLNLAQLWTGRGSP